MSTTYTLDDVVRTAIVEYQLENTEIAQQQYLQFACWFTEQYAIDINSRKTKNSERAQAPYFQLATNALCLYACLAGLRPVYDNKYDLDHTTLIDAEEKLSLLRSRGTGKELWTDMTLGSLCQRREAAKTKRSLPGYKELITMVGRYPSLVQKWGREIIYERDIGGKKRRGRREKMRKRGEK